MAEELSIVIGADVESAKAGINSISGVLDDFARRGQLSIAAVEGAMQNLKAIIKTTSDPSDLLKLNNAYTELQKKLNSLKLEGGLQQQLGGVSRATQLARSDVDQMTRSVALFASGSERGIDSLSNLIFTFERLKGVTGGGEEALAALTKAILSPEGLLIGVGAIVAVFGTFIEKLFSSEDGLFRSAEATEKLKQQISLLGEEIKNAKGFITDYTNALTFANRLGELSLKINGGSNIDLLNTKLGQTQELLSNAKIAIKQANDAFDELTNKPERAFGGKISDQIEKEIKDAIPKLAELTKDQTKIQGDAVILQQEIRLQGIENQKQASKLSDAIREGELQKIKDTISRAKDIQDQLGDAFIIKPLIKDDIIQKFSEQNLKLISQKEELIKKLKELDVSEALLGKDFTAGKEAIKTLIFKIDTQLLQGDLNNALSIIDRFSRESLDFFKIAIHLDIRLPKLVPEIDKAEFKKSIDTLIKEQNIVLKVLLDKPSLLETEDSIKKIFSDFSDKNIFTAFGRNAGQKFRDALLESVKIFDKGFVINPVLNTNDIIQTLTDNLSGLKSIELKIIKTEDFNAAIKTLIDLHDAGVTAGEAVRKAFLDAGRSGEDAAKAARAITDSYGGISKQTAIIAADIESTLTPAFQGLFDALIKGQNPIKAFFGAIVKGIEDVISKLIATAIQRQILALLVKPSSDQATSGIGAVGGIAGSAAAAAQQAAAAASLTALTTSSGLAATGLASVTATTTALATASGIATGAQTALASTAGIAAAALLAMAAAASANSGFALLGLLGLGFAEGGEPPVGKASIVGEKGWEIFVPKVPGTIISHDKSVNLLSNSVLIDSVRENNSVKEFLSAELIKQQLERIESRLLNTVYKISEKSDLTSRNLIERFATHTEAINKFVQSSTISNEYFKLVTNISNEKLTDSIKSFQYSTAEKIKDSILRQSEIKNPELIPASLMDVMRLFSSSHTETFNRTSTNGFYPQGGNNSLIPFGIQEFHIKDTTEKLICSFKETLLNQFKTIIESSFSNSTLSSILQGQDSSRLQTGTEKSFDTNEILNRSFKSITDKFTDYKLINVSDKLKESFSKEQFSSESIKQFFSSFSDSTNELKTELVNNSSFKEYFYENQKSVFAPLIKMVEGEYKSYENIFKQFDNKETSKEINTSFYNAFLSEITKEFIKQNLEHNKEKNISNTIERFINSISNIKEAFQKVTEKISDKVSVQNFTSTGITSNRFTDKFLSTKINVEKIINNTILSKDSVQTFSLEKLQREFHIPAFAGGGLVFGPTLGILGEGFGISRSNPEVIAPLNQLRNIVGGEFNFNHSFDGIFGISGADLLLTLSRASKTSQRVTGRNPFQ